MFTLLELYVLAFNALIVGPAWKEVQRHLNTISTLIIAFLIHRFLPVV